MNEVSVGEPRSLVELTIDGNVVKVPEGSTILDACRREEIDTPTLCWASNLTPVNVCRVCVVEVEGSRVLVPSCSRPVEPGMVVSTDSERVRTSRRMVYELLASSVEMDRADASVHAWMDNYGVRPERMGDREEIATVTQPPKVQDELYVRDYERCILCYKCVQACGDDAQHTYAIATAAGASTPTSRPSPMWPCLTRRASTAATASACAQRVRSCSRPSTTCARRAHGTRKPRVSPPRSVRSAAWAATSNSTSRRSR